MNINQLYSNLVKKANMKKVAGPNAARLRKLITDLNRVRGDKNLVDSLKQIASTSPNILEGSLRPFYSPNSHILTEDILQMFKSPHTYLDKGINKFINRINDNILSREARIGSLGGLDIANAFDQKLINKYLKDIPSK